MTIHEFFELLWDVLTFPKYFFKAEFWEGLLNLHISALFTFICLLLFIYSFFKHMIEKTEKEKEGIEDKKWNFWEESFWVFEGGFPKPSAFFLALFLFIFFFG